MSHKHWTLIYFDAHALFASNLKVIFTSNSKHPALICHENQLISFFILFVCWQRFFFGDKEIVWRRWFQEMRQVIWRSVNNLKISFEYQNTYIKIQSIQKIWTWKNGSFYILNWMKTTNLLFHEFGSLFFGLLMNI